MGKPDRNAHSGNRLARIRYTYARNAGRLWKGPGLYDDVERFALRHDTGIGGLVEKLLNNDFGYLRHSDPEYPF